MKLIFTSKHTKYEISVSVDFELKCSKFSETLPCLLFRFCRHDIITLELHLLITLKKVHKKVLWNI